MPSQDVTTSYNPLLYLQLFCNKVSIQWGKILVNLEYHPEHKQEENFCEIHV